MSCRHEAGKKRLQVCRQSCLLIHLFFRFLSFCFVFVFIYLVCFYSFIFCFFLLHVVFFFRFFFACLGHLCVLSIFLSFIYMLVRFIFLHFFFSVTEFIAILQIVIFSIVYFVVLDLPSLVLQVSCTSLESVSLVKH